MNGAGHAVLSHACPRTIAARRVSVFPWQSPVTAIPDCTSPVRGGLVLDCLFT